MFNIYHQEVKGILSKEGWAINNFTFSLYYAFKVSVYNRAFSSHSRVYHPLFTETLYG